LAQRLDLWLWHARVARSRTHCAQIAQSGLVRINRQRTEKSHALVRTGDILTLPDASGRSVRVLEILDIAARRGNATDAARLYRVVPEAALATMND
jgi:ribosome-associated heat shock protein Hsp15